ncbi:MAG TPA: SMP-30/gluconolactonase/LRE family protein [Nitrososphaera sp.]|nr:SMP-30/gluconolactonase/LRE family protein [Nitrososphaera sp.]
MPLTSIAESHTTSAIFLMVILSFTLSVVATRFASAQQQIQQIPNETDELVTYEKHSSFIKEFSIPSEERGLRGITTDSAGDAWFLHSTNKTSTIFKLEPDSGKFTQYPINGETAADDPVINLAAAQIVSDNERGSIWFTDARTNSIGKLDEASGQIKLWQIPTQNAGPMGIVLSPDGKSLWFAEITGNKIARFDIQAEKIVEYSTGEDSGPALLTFDEKGQLWVTLSFSDHIMLTQIGNNLASNSSIGMVNISLPKPDRFSPLGIAISGGKVYLSDHGSSRVIVADENSGLQSYNVYWTSPSAYPILPATLPGQVVVDKKSGNLYFPQHGGNRITEIRPQDGLMTEYDIPTGPISTVLFLTASDEGRIWFTEWASNKVAYLDTSKQVPFELQVQQKSITLTKSSEASTNVLTKSAAAANASTANSNSSSNNNSSSLSLSQVEVGLTGMSESGPMGIIYQANPPRVNLQGNSSSAAESTIQLKTEDNAKPGTYTAMIRVQAPEHDGLIISRLYPIKLVLDVPQPTSIQPGPSASNSSQVSTLFGIGDLIRALAIAAAIGLAAYIVYRRVKRKPIQS